MAITGAMTRSPSPLSVLSDIRAALFGALVLVSACVPAPRTAPPPKAHRPAQARPAPARPLPADWRDWPLARGDWSYWTIPGSTIAAFGEPNKPPLLALRCDLAEHRVSIARAIAPQSAPINQPMAIHTSFGDLFWPIVETPMLAHGKPGMAVPFAVTVRGANDQGLDQIAFSRGRFAVETPGAAPVALPDWAEIARVVEDCRG